MHLHFILVLLFVFSIYFSFRIKFAAVTLGDKIIMVILIALSTYIFTISLFMEELYLPPDTVTIEASPLVHTHEYTSHAYSKNNSGTITYANYHADHPFEIFSSRHAWIVIPFIVLYCYLVMKVVIYLFIKNKSDVM